MICYLTWPILVSHVTCDPLIIVCSHKTTASTSLSVHNYIRCQIQFQKFVKKLANSPGPYVEQPRGTLQGEKLQNYPPRKSKGNAVQ